MTSNPDQQGAKAMDFIQLHQTLRSMLPVDVRLHLQVGLQSCWSGRDPAVKRESELKLELEIDACAFQDGISAHVNGETAEQIVERFQAVVLPALNLGPDVPSVSERLSRLNFNVSDH